MQPVRGAFNLRWTTVMNLRFSVWVIMLQVSESMALPLYRVLQPRYFSAKCRHQFYINRQRDLQTTTASHLQIVSQYLQVEPGRPIATPVRPL